MAMLSSLSRVFGNTFTLWVLVFAGLALYQPDWFLLFGGWIVPMLGLVMFGMGLTLKASDFREVARNPCECCWA